MSAERRIIVHHARGRATVVLAILIFVAAVLLHAAISPMSGWVGAAIYALAFLLAAWMAVALLAQTMSGTALLEATDDAIVVGSPAGRIIIPWVTVETITVSERLPGDWLRIQLRDGMRPDGSLLARIWSTSL